MYSLELETIADFFLTEAIFIGISVITTLIAAYIMYGIKSIVKKIRMRLVIRRIEKSLKMDIENNKYIKDECPICFEENKHVLKSKCQHIICKDCWMSIIIKFNTCPFCRRDIDIKKLQYIKKNEK